jgi:hypothetical protein
MPFEVFRSALSASCIGSVSFRHLIAGLLSSKKIVGTFRHVSVRTRCWRVRIQRIRQPTVSRQCKRFALGP